jgi:hypothetical protein
MFQDMPAIIEVVTGVRLADIKKSDDYINVDSLEAITRLEKTNSNYKNQLQQLT